MWLPLQNVKMGRLHLAITVVDHGKEVDATCKQETVDTEEMRKSSLKNETAKNLDPGGWAEQFLQAKHFTHTRSLPVSATRRRLCGSDLIRRSTKY
ncbi:C2 domain-containing protein At1g53590-like [Arachis ipaensis]|uniref:C2 domain-containing protein At1g53590-like n=1 Tax=Arachis ipaensis TaxID=130454 RepID=UPI000A2B703D|nr:C2 domain-containing protein At1g53590-like [Arachis ipaensis]